MSGSLLESLFWFYQFFSLPQVSVSHLTISFLGADFFVWQLTRISLLVLSIFLSSSSECVTLDHFFSGSCFFLSGSLLESSLLVLSIFLSSSSECVTLDHFFLGAVFFVWQLTRISLLVLSIFLSSSSECVTLDHFFSGSCFFLSGSLLESLFWPQVSVSHLTISFLGAVFFVWQLTRISLGFINFSRDSSKLPDKKNSSQKRNGQV